MGRMATGRISRKVLTGRVKEVIGRRKKGRSLPIWQDQVLGFLKGMQDEEGCEIVDDSVDTGRSRRVTNKISWYKVCFDRARWRSVVRSLYGRGRIRKERVE